MRHKLYVHVEERDGFRDLLPIIYLNAASIRSEIDLRVLVDRRTIHGVDRIFYDEVYLFVFIKAIAFLLGQGSGPSRLSHVQRG